MVALTDCRKVCWGDMSGCVRKLFECTNPPCEWRQLCGNTRPLSSYHSFVGSHLRWCFNGEWYVIGYLGFDLHDGGDGDSKLVERFMGLDAGDIRVVYHRNHHTASPTDVGR